MWGTRSAIDFFLVLGTELLTYNDRYKIMLDWLKKSHLMLVWEAKTCLVLLYFFQLLLKVHPIAHLGICLFKKKRPFNHVFGADGIWRP